MKALALLGCVDYGIKLKLLCRFVFVSYLCQ
nr:MAG TPA: hypothetical protein [Caudoviricetes sp.]